MVAPMQFFILKQHKQTIIYCFFFSFAILASKKESMYLWSVYHNLVKNNSPINEKTLVSYIFVGWKKKKKNPTEK